MNVQAEGGGSSDSASNSSRSSSGSNLLPTFLAVEVVYDSIYHLTAAAAGNSEMTLTSL